MDIFRSGLSWLNNVNCFGTEESILDCPAVTGSDVVCDHTSEAGVICSNGKELNINYVHIHTYTYTYTQ